MAEPIPHRFTGPQIVVCLIAGMLASAPIVRAQAFTRVASPGLTTESLESLGVAWGDFDNDGLLDLFVANGRHRNSLFHNDGEGGFSRVVNGPIGADIADSRGSLWVDYDNDGDLDLYVSNRGGNVPPPVTVPVQANFLYRNDGPPNFTFTKVTDELPATLLNFTWSSSWVDYDNDGDVDLHVLDNLHAADDFFLENDGQGHFTEVIPSFIEKGSGPSTGVASWIDFDDDGDQDVLLAKSGRFLGPGAENNRMYKGTLSESGTLGFEEVTTGGIVTHFDNDFQVSWADYDNDGDMDAFLGHAGGPKGIQNFLYRNDGNGLLVKVTTGPVVTDQTGTLGSGWGDYDNDGDLDLFTANGGADKLYRNNGDGTFTSTTQSMVGSIVTTQGNSWGAAWADYDNDGFLDIMVVNDGAPNFLYRNSGSNGNHWINITANGTSSSRSAIGAKIRVKAKIFGQDLWQVRHISGSPTGDRSQNSLRAHFGLGDATVIDTVRVEWPSGLIEEYSQLAADQFMTILEGTAVSTQGAPDSPGPVIKSENYPNPFQDSTTVRFSMPTSGHVRLVVFDLLGREVKVLSDGQRPAGVHEEIFHAGTLPVGTYFYRLEAESYAVSKPIMRAAQ